MRAARVIPTALLAGLFLTLPGTLPGIGRLGGPPTAEAATAASAAEQMLTLVNAERRKAGCDAVRLDPRLTSAASKHSADMATNDYFSHTGRNGTGFATRMEAAGHSTPLSENIAAGNSTAQATLTRWMDSAGHRRNILDCSAKDMGVGVATDPGSTYGIYWTQDFGRG
jgi:uncharacterized protein YkwD